MNNRPDAADLEIFRRLRDSARAHVAKDIAIVRDHMSPGRIVRDIGESVGNTFYDIADEAADWSKSHKWALLGAGGLLGLWLAREPLLEMLGGDDDEDTEAE